MKYGLYLTKGTVMTRILKHSPFPLQRRFYKESLLMHGGFYESTTMLKDVMVKIQAGRAVFLSLNTLLSKYKHLFVMAKEDLFFAYMGYYAQQNLPLLTEVQMGILHFFECGITEEVMMENIYYLQSFLFQTQNDL